MTEEIRYKHWLNNGNPGEIASAARKVLLGSMLSEVKVVATGLTAAAAFDITTAAVKAASTITGMTLVTGENLPAIGIVRNLRVATSGTANSVGSYVVCDASGTAVSPTAGANIGIATLSDDGKTLTFPTTVTGFTLTYYPKAAAALDTDVGTGI